MPSFPAALAADVGPSVQLDIPTSAALLERQTSALHLANADPATAAMHSAIARSKDTKKNLTTLNHRVPAVVAFQVGGKQFALGKSLIEKDPQSLLFTLANEHYGRSTDRCRDADSGRMSPPAKRTKTEAREAPLLCDDSPIIIPDRDPDIFARLLNLVRGYRNAIPNEHWRDACESDVTFYGLQKSWHGRFPPPHNYKFSLRSVSSFMTSATACGVASAYFTTGKHDITFAVTLQGTERVAVGVESQDKNEGTELVTSAEHGEAFNRALYWNDGSVTSFFTYAQCVASGCSYKSSAVIRVHLDASEGTVRWATRHYDCVCMLRLPRRESGYAFCAITQNGSQVNIVSSE